MSEVIDFHLCATARDVNTSCHKVNYGANSIFVNLDGSVLNGSSASQIPTNRDSVTLDVIRNLKTSKCFISQE